MDTNSPIDTVMHRRTACRARLVRPARGASVKGPVLS